jgi:superfamily II DNA/RNA helicase
LHAKYWLLFQSTSECHGQLAHQVQLEHWMHLPGLYLQVQLLLFSATFNDLVKKFAQSISPSANQVPSDFVSLSC